MKVTIKDVSNMTGISCSTISRVLSNSGYVKAETRELVEKAVAQNGYSYSPSRGKSNKDHLDVVLVLCGDIASQVYVSYIRGITRKLEKEHLKVVCFDSLYIAQKEEEYLKYAIHNGFAGVIMLNAISTESLMNLLKTMVYPIVLVNRQLRAVETDVVLIDNYFGGYIATKYLIDFGHKRIAHLGGPENSSTCHDRMRGYISAMNDAGLVVQDDDIFYGDLQYDSGYSFGTHLMDQKKDITAVFSSNDIMAAALVEALYEKGCNVPENLSVVCMDNTINALNSRTKLTTVSYDNEMMGIAAAEMLLERIKNPEGKKKKIVYAPILTERNSVKRL
jgi:LacI family transcriptional regulator